MRCTSPLCLLAFAAASAAPPPRVKASGSSLLWPDGRRAQFRGACVTESSTVQHVSRLVDVSDEKLDWFAGQGLNVLRVGVHWSLLETAPGVYDGSYLDALERLLRRMETRGVFAIIDMHQDQWSEFYCLGHGVPTWYAGPPDVAKYARGGAAAYPEPVASPSDIGYVAEEGLGTDINCTKWTAGYGSAGSLYTYALGAATQRMYDEPKLQKAFGEFWKRVAARTRKSANVIAFELVNEPWYGAVKLEKGDGGVDGWRLAQPAADSAPSISRLHAALHAAIRDVDDDTLLLFEPGAGGAAYAEPTGYTEGPGGDARGPARSQSTVEPKTSREV